jgi:four helix bundle protein
MPKTEAQMSNQDLSSNDKKKYDLEERTSLFGEAVIIFLSKLPKNQTNNTLVGQLVRSATSVGANYMEADCAESKKDFCHKIMICKKEAKETTYWLRMVACANPDLVDACNDLKKEAHEFILIFSSIIRSAKEKEV